MVTDLKLDDPSSFLPHFLHHPHLEAPALGMGDIQRNASLTCSLSNRKGFQTWAAMRKSTYCLYTIFCFLGLITQAQVAICCFHLPVTLWKNVLMSNCCTVTTLTWQDQALQYHNIQNKEIKTKFHLSQISFFSLSHYSTKNQVLTVLLMNLLIKHSWVL